MAFDINSLSDEEKKLYALASPEEWEEWANFSKGNTGLKDYNKIYLTQDEIDAQPGVLKRGLMGGGVYGTGSLLTGAAGLAADAVGADDTAQYLLEKSQGIAQKGQELYPQKVDFDQMLEDPSLSNIGEWLGYNVAATAPMMVGSMGVGGAVGLGAKSLLKKAAMEAGETAIKSATAAELAGIGAEEIAKKASLEFLSKNAARAGTAGAAAAMSPVEAGGMWIDDAQKHGVENTSPFQDALMGGVSGAIEMLPGSESRIIRAAFGDLGEESFKKAVREGNRKVADSILGKAMQRIESGAIEGGKEFLGEGAQESLQELTAMGNEAINATPGENPDLFTDRGLKRLAESGIVGGAVGFGTGGVTGMIRHGADSNKSSELNSGQPETVVPSSGGVTDLLNVGSFEDDVPDFGESAAPVASQQPASPVQKPRTADQVIDLLGNESGNLGDLKNMNPQERQKEMFNQGNIDPRTDALMRQSYVGAGGFPSDIGQGQAAGAAQVFDARDKQTEQQKLTGLLGGLAQAKQQAEVQAQEQAVVQSQIGADLLRQRLEQEQQAAMQVPVEAAQPIQQQPYVPEQIPQNVEPMPMAQPIVQPEVMAAPEMPVQQIQQQEVFQPPVLEAPVIPEPVVENKQPVIHQPGTRIEWKDKSGNTLAGKITVVKGKRYEIERENPQPGQGRKTFLHTSYDVRAGEKEDIKQPEETTSSILPESNYNSVADGETKEPDPSFEKLLDLGLVKEPNHASPQYKYKRDINSTHFYGANSKEGAIEGALTAYGRTDAEHLIPQTERIAKIEAEKQAERTRRFESQSTEKIEAELSSNISELEKLNRKMASLGVNAYGTQRRASVSAGLQSLSERNQELKAVLSDREAAGPQSKKETTDFPTERVKAAYAHSSTSPGNAAKVENTDFENSAKNLEESLKEHLGDDERIPAAVEQYKSDYLKNREPVWNARSSTYSSMVAGKSKLNIKQVENRNNSLEKAESIFSGWQKAAIHKIESSLGVPAIRADKAEKTTVEKQENKAAKDTALVKAFMNLKVGDEFNPGGNNNVVVKRKSKLSVTSEGGATYTLKELTGVKHDEALKIMNKAEKLNPSEPVENKAKNTSADRIEEVAKKLMADADSRERADRQTNTYKRANQAASSIAKALADKNLAKTMISLADSMKKGTAKHLGGVKSKADLETIGAIIKRAVLKTENDKKYYGDRDPDRDFIESKDARNIKYPYPSLHIETINDLMKGLDKVRGGKKFSDKILNVRRRSVVNSMAVVTRKEDIELIREAVRLLPSDRDSQWLKKRIQDNFVHYDRVQRMGIKDTEELEQAIIEYSELKAPREKEDPVKALEREIYTQKNIGIDFFPTSKEIAADMAERLDVKPGMSVLEPSAGSGRLIDAVKETEPDAKIEAVEMSSKLRELLNARGDNVVEHNFMDLEKDKLYDRIIMNPPFSNSLDIEHVMKAYEHLKPGGKIVAIMGEGAFFRNDKKATGFREWLDEIGGTSEKLPEKSFNHDDMVQKTGVNARMVEIDKPEQKNIYGKNGSSFLSDNSKIDFKYKIAEASEPVASHDNSFLENPAYPQEIQPRERGKRDALKLQVESMANAINPEKIAESATLSSGAPVVGNDGVVESGNGRIIALRKAYSDGRAGEYKKWLSDNAERFGFDKKQIESMKSPVLLRERQTEVEDRSLFAKLANKDEVARMSASEDAASDADLITKDDLKVFAPSEDGDIGAYSNKSFINRFLGKLSASEKAGYLTEDGRATRQLVDRIRSAVFHKAYESASLTSLAAEEANPDIKNILNALLAAAPEFVKAKAFDEKLAETGIIDAVVEAVDIIRKARNDYESVQATDGQTKLHAQVEAAVSQPKLFAKENESEEGKRLALYIAANIRSAKRIGLFLKHLAGSLREYLSDLNQKTMFGDKADFSLLTAIDNAERAFKNGQGEGQELWGGDSRNEQADGRNKQPGHRRATSEIMGSDSKGVGISEAGEVGQGKAGLKVSEPAASFVNKDTRPYSIDFENIESEALSEKDKWNVVDVETTGYIAAQGFEVKSHDDAAALVSGLQRLPQENLYFICVGKNGIVTEINRHSVGTNNSTFHDNISISSRIFANPDTEVVYTAHNHPGGSLEPSSGDYEVFDRLQNILTSKEIKAYGIIVGDGKYSVYNRDDVSEPFDIPEVVAKTKIPVKERVLVQKADNSLGQINSAAKMKAAAGKIGRAFVFLDGHNNAVGILPFPSGMDSRDLASLVLQKAGESNAHKFALVTDKLTESAKAFLAAMQGDEHELKLVEVIVGGESFKKLTGSRIEADRDGFRTINIGFPVYSLSDKKNDSNVSAQKISDALQSGASRMPFNVVESEKDLPQYIKEDIESKGFSGRAEALFDPESGKVFFIAKNIGSIQAAQTGFLENLIRHEGRHAVISQMFSDKGSKNLFMDRAARAFKSDVESYLKKNGLDNSKENVRMAAEEALVDQTVKGGVHALLDEFASKVMRWARKIFSGLGMSRAEAMAFIRKADTMLRGDISAQKEGFFGKFDVKDVLGSAKYSIKDKKTVEGTKASYPKKGSLKPFGPVFLKKWYDIGLEHKQYVKNKLDEGWSWRTLFEDLQNNKGLDFGMDGSTWARWSIFKAAVKDYPFETKEYKRLGSVPAQADGEFVGRSYNYMDQVHEDGVSVMDDEWLNSHRGMWMLAHKRKPVKVFGVQVGTGSDGEPVIIPVKNEDNPDIRYSVKDRETVTSLKDLKINAEYKEVRSFDENKEPVTTNQLVITGEFRDEFKKIMPLIGGEYKYQTKNDMFTRGRTGKNTYVFNNPSEDIEQKIIQVIRAYHQLDNLGLTARFWKKDSESDGTLFVDGQNLGMLSETMKRIGGKLVKPQDSTKKPYFVFNLPDSSTPGEIATAARAFNSTLARMQQTSRDMGEQAFNDIVSPVNETMKAKGQRIIEDVKSLFSKSNIKLPSNNTDITKGLHELVTGQELAKNDAVFKEAYDVNSKYNAMSTQMTTQDRELTRPYYDLDQENRKPVDKALIAEDAERVEFSTAVLKERFKLTPEQLEGHKSMRGLYKKKLRDVVADMLKHTFRDLHFDDAFTEQVLASESREAMIRLLHEHGVMGKDDKKVSWLYDWVDERVGYIPHKWDSEWLVRVNMPDGDTYLLPVPTITGNILPTKALREGAANKAAIRVIKERIGWNDSQISEWMDAGNILLVKNKELPVDLFHGASMHVMSAIIDSATDQAWAERKIEYSPEQLLNKADLKAAIRKEMEELFLAKGAGAHFIARKGVKGFRTDIAQVTGEYIAGFNSFMVKRDKAVEFAKVVGKIDPKQTPNRFKAIKDFVDDMLGDSNEVPWFKRMAGIWFLGMDVSAAALNSFQNFTHAVPMMLKIRGGNNSGNVYKQITKAMKDVTAEWNDARKSGRKIFTGDDESFVTKAEKEIIRNLFEQGFFDPALVGEQTGFHPSKVWDNYADQTTKVMMGMFTAVESMNRASTFIAAHRRAVAAGIADPIGTSKQIVMDAHFAGGKENRPALVRKMGAIGNIGYTFMMYPANNLFFLKNLFKDALISYHGKDSDKLSSDLKAIGAHMGALFSLGGLAATPFASIWAPLVKGIFSDDDDDWEVALRKHLHPEVGRWLVRGVPALLGNDMSGRVSSDVIGMPAGFGVINTMYKRALKAGDYAVQGEYLDSVMAMSPDFVRNPYNAVMGMTEGGEKKGRSPIKYNAWQAANKALGFSPTAETEAYASKQSLDNVKAKKLDRREHFAEQLLQLQKKNDSISISKLRKELNEYNELQKKDDDPVIKWSDVIKSANQRRKMRNKGYMDRTPKNMKSQKAATLEAMGS